MLLNRRAVRAWLTLAAFLCTFALSAAGADHLAAADDTACATARKAESRPGDARLDAAPDGAVPAHCALCHFQRASDGAAPSHHTRIAAPAGRSVPISLPSAVAHLRARRARSSRAPPSLV